MTEECRTITKYLGCGFELFERETDGNRILSRWRELSQAGPREGFFPLIIPVSGLLAETLDIALEESDLLESPDGPQIIRDQILAEARQTDPVTILRPLGDGDFGEYLPGQPDNVFRAYMDGGVPYEEVLIAKIPAKAPWELPAWVPMGGYNECPAPESQVAVFRYWHENYGAVPVSATNAIWEMHVPRPPQTEAEAMTLAAGQYAFCQDIVSQGTATVGALAGLLKGANAWYFWWD